jgi:hypothetical protein
MGCQLPLPGDFDQRPMICQTEDHRQDEKKTGPEEIFLQHLAELLHRPFSFTLAHDMVIFYEKFSVFAFR